jgi:cell division septum initiation protein DivIVA
VSDVTYTLEGEITRLAHKAQLFHEMAKDLDRENAQLKAENARLRSEVNIARERLGPAGYKILEKYLSLQAVADAARSLLSEEGVKEYLSAYVQGCKLIEALDDEKGREVGEI